jgi:LAGLIDADG endonuclease
LLKKFLGGGFIIEERNSNVVRLRGESLSFMLEAIIPLFNNNPLQSSKFKDYISFAQLVN